MSSLTIRSGTSRLPRACPGGEFSTFNGGLARTNCSHPLRLFPIAPFYRVLDKVEALFATKAFEIMLIAGGVAPVAVASRESVQPMHDRMTGRALRAARENGGIADPFDAGGSCAYDARHGGGGDWRCAALR